MKRTRSSKFKKKKKKIKGGGGVTACPREKGLVSLIAEGASRWYWMPEAESQYSCLGAGAELCTNRPFLSGNHVHYYTLIPPLISSCLTFHFGGHHRRLKAGRTVFFGQKTTPFCGDFMFDVLVLCFALKYKDLRMFIPLAPVECWGFQTVSNRINNSIKL